MLCSEEDTIQGEYAGGRIRAAVEVMPAGNKKNTTTRTAFPGSVKCPIVSVIMEIKPVTRTNAGMSRGCTETTGSSPVERSFSRPGMLLVSERAQVSTAPDSQGPGGSAYSRLRYQRQLALLE